MAKRLLIMLCLALSLSACGAGPGTGRGAELTIFADASLSDALEEIAGRYRADAPQIRTRLVCASSGELSRRIRDGAECDIFLCASSAPMDALDGAFRGDPERNPDNADLLLADSRVTLTGNQVALAVPPGNPSGLRNFAHLSALIRRNGLLFATANAGDPLGVCAENAFALYSLTAQDVSQGFAFASDAREAAVRVKSGMADGGILYRTDADGLLIVDTGETVAYCGAVLSESARPLAASAFLEYLTGPDAAEIFLRAGFSPLSGAVPDAGPYWEALLPEDG